MRYSRTDGVGEVSNAHLWPIVAGSVVTDDRGRYSFPRMQAGRSIVLLAYRPRSYGTGVADAPADPRARAATLAAMDYPAADTMESAQPIVLGTFERREDADIHMRRLPAFCVEAILTRDGMPASLDFRVEEEDVSRLQSLNSPNPPWLRGGRSGPDGRIRVCDLVDGRFRVTAFETARVIETVRSGSVGFVVDGADVHAGMVAAEPPVTVSGEVRWDRPPTALSVPDVFRFSTTATFGAGGVSVSSIPGQFSMRVLAGMPYSFLVSGLQPPLGT